VKIIDDKIMTAIARLRVVCDGNNSEVARKFGVTRSHIGNIFKGKVTYFEPKTWERIEPILSPYIRDIHPSIKSCNDSTDLDSPELNIIISIVKDWPSNWQSRALTAIREVQIEYEHEKNKATSTGDPGELQADRTA